ncbi:MAG TPA: hypothetical protein VGD68_17100 [Streptosporangiaceae bacterium]
MRIRARLAAVLCSTITVLAALTVSACTGSGSPNAAGSASTTFFTAKAPGSGTATPTSSPSATITASPAPSTETPVTPSPSPTPSATQAPIGAPSTGGGGTAGLQHASLFGFGALAVLAGIGSLLYRRRVLRR